MTVLMVFVWSLLLSLVLSFIYRFLTKPSKIRNLKKDMKFYREKMSESQKSGNKEESDKYLKESMRLNQEHLKENMKPMIFSMILFIIVLGWLGGTYAELTVPLPITLPVTGWEFPFIGMTMQYNWFWWYLVITVPFTFVFRKLLGVE